MGSRRGPHKKKSRCQKAIQSDHVHHSIAVLNMQPQIPAVRTHAITAAIRATPTSERRNG
jgi:hypothetical protein